MNEAKLKILYLDVDGVLLGKADPGDISIILAKYAREFLEYAIRSFDCYWLTSHGKDGNINAVIDWITRYADEETLRLVSVIKPAVWKTLKTEAIDFKSDFYWVDDQLLWSEMRVLQENNAMERWIQIDTRKNPDDLKRAIVVLKEKTKK